MEFEFIFPKKGNEPIVKESLTGKGLRNVTAGISNAVSSVSNLVTLPETLYKHAENTRNQTVNHALKPGNEKYLYGSNPEKTREGLEQYQSNPTEGIISPIVEKGNKLVKSLFPEGYLEPKNEIEENIQDILGNVAFNTASFIGTGGFSAAPKLSTFFKQLGNVAVQSGKRSVQGKAGKYATKSIGLGEGSQFLAEIGTPALIQSLNVDNLVKGLKPITQELYDNTEKIGKNKYIEYPKLRNKVHKISNEKYLRLPEHKDLKYNLELMKNSVRSQDGKINLNDALKIKTTLNELVHESKIPDTAKTIYNRFLPDYNKILEIGSKQYPTFGENYNAANNLKQLSIQTDKAAKFIKDSYGSLKDSNGYKKLGYLFTTPFKSYEQSKNTISSAAQIATDHPKQFIEYYGKALEAASKNQLQPFLNNINKMDKLVKDKDEFEFIF